MLRRTYHLVVLLFMIGVPMLAAEIKVNVSANRKQIYLGESLVLTVRVSGTDAPQQPDLSAIKDCRIAFLGTHSDSRRSIVIINGRMRRTGHVGRVFSFELTPSKAGVFLAGPVSLTAGGKTIKKQGPGVTVSGIEPQETVQIQVIPSRLSALVDERFDITLSIAVKRLKGKYADIDALLPNAPPALQAPFLDVEPISGLEGPDMRQILQKRLVTRQNAPGFSVNNYREPRGILNFDSFFDERKARFMFNRSAVQKDGKSYFLYTLKLSYKANEEGSYTFGPVVFKGKVITDIASRGYAKSKRIFAVGPACTVRIVPPPEEGRPASFIGAIGANMSAAAAFDTQTCNVGDPLTLTLSVTGKFSLANLSPPNLEAQLDLTQRFRIYEETVKMISKPAGKDFVYTVRPTQAGTLEFPPVEISYYDVSERRYKTVKTDPIPIRANEAAELAPEDIISATANDTSVTPAGRPAKQELIVAPITMNPQGATPDTLGIRSLVAWLVSVFPLAYLLLLAIQVTHQRSVRSAGARRRRHALGQALHCLRAAENAADANPLDARRAILRSLRKYLAERFDTGETGMTPADARQTLLENGIAPDIAERMVAVFERNFNAEFAQDAGPRNNLSADAGDTRTILRQIDSVADKRT